jgi:hypothetical protein
VSRRAFTCSGGRFVYMLTTQCRLAHGHVGTATRFCACTWSLETQTEVRRCAMQGTTSRPRAPTTPSRTSRDSRATRASAIRRRQACCIHAKMPRVGRLPGGRTPHGVQVLSRLLVPRASLSPCRMAWQSSSTTCNVPWRHHRSFGALYVAFCRLQGADGMCDVGWHLFVCTAIAGAKQS